MRPAEGYRPWGAAFALAAGKTLGMPSKLSKPVRKR